MITRRFGFVLPLLLSSVAFAQYAPQQAGTAPLEPELEARVQALGDQLRCPTCQGLSIADSSAATARSQLDMVRTLVKEGKSDAEIKQFFVDRYGEWALLRPSRSGVNLVVWGGPVALLLGGLAFIVWFALRSRNEGRAAAVAQPSPALPPEAPAAPAAADEDPYLSAVRAELER